MRMLNQKNKQTNRKKIRKSHICLFGSLLVIIGISILGAVYFQCIGSAKISMVLGILRQVILLVPAILIIPKFLGLNGVWISQPVADAGSATIIGILLFREFRKYKCE